MAASREPGSKFKAGARRILIEGAEGVIRRLLEIAAGEDVELAINACRTLLPYMVPKPDATLLVSLDATAAPRQMTVEQLRTLTAARRVLDTGDEPDDEPDEH